MPVVYPSPVLVTHSVVAPGLVLPTIYPDPLVATWSVPAPTIPGELDGPPLYLAQMALAIMLADCATFRTWTGTTTRVRALLHIHLEGLPKPANNADEHALAELQAYRPYVIIYPGEEAGQTDFYEASGDHSEFEQSGILIAEFVQDCPGGVTDEPSSDANRQWKNTLGQILDELCDLAGDGSDGNYLDFHTAKLSDGPYWGHPRVAETQGVWQAAQLQVEW